MNVAELRAAVGRAATQPIFTHPPRQRRNYVRHPKTGDIVPDGELSKDDWADLDSRRDAADGAGSEPPAESSEEGALTELNSDVPRGEMASDDVRRMAGAMLAAAPGALACVWLHRDGRVLGGGLTHPRKGQKISTAVFKHSLRSVAPHAKTLVFATVGAVDPKIRDEVLKCAECFSYFVQEFLVGSRS